MADVAGRPGQNVVANVGIVPPSGPRSPRYSTAVQDDDVDAFLNALIVARVLSVVRRSRERLPSWTELRDDAIRMDQRRARRFLRHLLPAMDRKASWSLGFLEEVVTGVAFGNPIVRYRLTAAGEQWLLKAAPLLEQLRICPGHGGDPADEEDAHDVQCYLSPVIVWRVLHYIQGEAHWGDLRDRAVRKKQEQARRFIGCLLKPVRSTPGEPRSVGFLAKLEEPPESVVVVERYVPTPEARRWLTTFDPVLEHLRLPQRESGWDWEPVPNRRAPMSDPAEPECEAGASGDGPGDDEDDAADTAGRPSP